MIGATPQKAVPVIMVSCEHRETRKAVVAALRNSGILDQCPPAMDFGGWDYPPYISNLEMFARPSFLDPSHDIFRLNAAVRPNNVGQTMPEPIAFGGAGTVPCQALQLKLYKQSMGVKTHCTAAVGAFVILSGKRFLLMTAHVFCSPQYTQRQLDSELDDSECDFGRFIDPEESATYTQDVELIRQFSLTPQSSSQERDRSLSQDESISETLSRSNCFSPTVKVEEENSENFNFSTNTPMPFLYLSHPVRESSYLRSDALDYCLIGLDATFPPFVDLPILSRDNVGCLDSGSADVTVATSSGQIVSGILSSKRTCIRLLNTAKFIDALSARFESPLGPGDSGSIVKDIKTGKIYGHVIAGDKVAKFAIIVPAGDVLNDIARKSKRGLSGIPLNDQGISALSISCSSSAVPKRDSLSSEQFTTPDKGFVFGKSDSFPTFEEFKSTPETSESSRSEPSIHISQTSFPSDDLVFQFSDRNTSHPIQPGSQVAHSKPDGINELPPAGLKCLWMGCSYHGTFRSKATLMRHISAKHVNPGTFKCSSCDKLFNRKDNLEYHLRAKHADGL